MIEYIVKKKKITILFFVMAILIGSYRFTQLPKQEMPDIILKQAIVTTIYPGATPEKVEQTVTKPIEQKIKEVQGIKKISSISENGLSTIHIETEGHADAKAIWDEVRKKVQDAKADLPNDAQQPVINDDLNKAFIQSYAITANSIEQIYELHNLMISWKDQLRTVPGVSEVTIKGIPDQEVRVQIDMQKLQQYHISWEQLMQSVQKENEHYPIGNVDYNERTYQLIVKESKDVANLNQVIISRTDSGAPIYLKDVGRVALTHKSPDYMPFFNGKPALTISISSNTGSDVPAMHARVAEKMDELQRSLPKQYQLEIVFSQMDRVNKIFHGLTREFIFAMLSVIFVCTLGLNLLTASFVAMAIPISVAIGFIILPMMGVTLNQVSVVGLIIVMGILVDDAVVVNDNIERRLNTLGENPSVAAVQGTKEVAISIVTATLATIAAFAPLLLLSGDVGSFIKPIPTVVSFTMLASMIMSFTIIPIFRQWYESWRHSKEKLNNRKSAGLLGKQIDILRDVYAGKLMPKVLKQPLLVGMSGLLISTLAYGLIMFTPIELFPRSDDPQLTINIRLPIGTSIQETNRVTRDISNWAKQQPNVKTVTYAAGGDAPELFKDVSAESKSGVMIGQVAVLGEEGKFNAEEASEKWVTQLEKRYPGLPITLKVPKLGVPVGKPVSIRISGEDLEQLRSLSQQVKEVVLSIKGTKDVQDNIGMDRYALEFQVNKEAMDQYLVNYTDLTRTLQLIGQGVDFSNFDTGKKLIDIKMTLENAKQDPNILFQQVHVTNANGEQIPLAQLTELKPSFSIQKINHYNLVRTITVEADVDGRTATDVMEEIKQKMSRVQFPPGYGWESDGETSEQEDIFKDLGKLYIVVIFLIFMLIVMQFYSLSIPFIVMTTVYMAISGGLIGLFFTRTPLGFMSIMGLIALAGIVVRNGIVLIEFIEDSRQEGMDVKEAVIQAASARFRPILLTSLTAMVGMIPIALMGELLFKPLAYTIIFGLIFSTLLTLLVVPSLYMVLAQWKLKRQNKKNGWNLNKESLTIE